MEELESLHIARITREYQDAAKDIILEGFKERFGFVDDRFNPDLKSIMDSYSGNGCVFLIALNRNHVVCTGALLKESDIAGRIVRMSVKGKFRRRGYAQ